MRKEYAIEAFLSFAMYFLTGTACLVVGGSLPYLVDLYNMKLNHVVLMGSAYAMGRVIAAYRVGRLVEILGIKKVLTAGVVLISFFFIGIPIVKNYYAGLFLAFLGGVGMASQDTVCPVLLSAAFSDNYASALSAGQALFGLGAFTTPLLIGLLLRADLPFYYSYYILLLVPFVMLVCIPFVKANIDNSKAKVRIVSVKPLYTRKKLLAYLAIFFVCITYSATVNTLGLYISTFALDLGVSQSSSAFMLTLFNVGSVLGALAFIFILRKISSRNVLIMNNAIALMAIIAGLLVNKIPVFFVMLFIAGFFLGVLFSLIVEVATRIGYNRISIAGSLVATVSGSSDILTPIITGFLIARIGIKFSFIYTIIMIFICLIAAVILKIYTTDQKMEVFQDVTSE